MDLTLKYRPHTWDDVVGQDFVVDILRKQIATHTFKNAYLFCGAWGDGKTTCARIFANEINGGKGSPIEIDGASNNGVDNIRALIEDAQTSAVDAEYKTYLIDEAHMITTQGWNAALKLIEEPPSHCIFIFCTTNPEKIPNTILSRVQRFDFKKISADKIAGRLEYILQSEGCESYDKIALEKLAILSEGHMRDAVKMLAMCLDIDRNISVDLVETTFGLVKQDVVNRFIKGLVTKNLTECTTEYNNCEKRNYNKISFYDSVLSTILDAIVKNNRGDLKPIMNVLYDNRKILTRDNADAVIKYIIAEVCI